MKTRLFLFFSAAFLSNVNGVMAQWTAPSGGSSWTTAGTNLIGIGTVTPQARLSFENVTTTIPVGAAPNGMTWHNASGAAGAAAYGIYRTFGSWSLPDYQQLLVNWQTGIVLNPGTTGGKSFVEVQGNGMRVTSGKLYVGEYDPSGTIQKASISYAGSATADAISPLVVSKKITGTSDFRRILFIPHNIGGGYCWMAQDGDMSILAHNSATGGPNALVIGPSSNSWAGMRIAGTGNVGIATNLATNPYNFTLGVAAANLGTGSGIWVQTNNAHYGIKIDAPGNSIGSYVGPTKAIVVTDGTNEKFRVNNAGSVYAKELYLMYGAFPDYVFQKDYELKELSEVEKFIATNSHLPNMPSAAEVEKNGIGTAELESKLLEKVEELTLYMIQQDKKIKALEAENKNILESIHSK